MEKIFRLHFANVSALIERCGRGRTVPLRQALASVRFEADDYGFEALGVSSGALPTSPRLHISAERPRHAYYWRSKHSLSLATSPPRESFCEKALYTASGRKGPCTAVVGRSG